MTRTVEQLGIVVTDLDEAMRSWTAAGVGPFYVSRARTFRAYVYRGDPAPAPRISVAVAQAGPVQIELIQQLDDAPSAYTEFLAAGRIGVQHVGSWFRDPADYDTAYAELEREGLVEVQSGVGSGGRWSYFTAASDQQPLLELCETRGVLGEVFDLVRDAAIGWDGSDPIRTADWPSAG